MRNDLKRFLLLFLILIFSSSASFAIEEIKLEPMQTQMNFNYLSDVYYGKIENTEDVSPVLRLFSEKGLIFENSKINSVKAYFLYDGTTTFSTTAHHSSHLSYNFVTLEPMISMKFNDNKSEVMFDYNFARRMSGYSNGFTERISRIYISHRLNDNQMLVFGQSDRVPNSYDGSRNIMSQEMVLKTQLGRTFGNVLSVGIRNQASYKYLDYDIGLYDSTRYMKDFGSGLDFTGRIVLKPFANIEKIGDFKIGTAYGIGHSDVSYNTYSFYTAYNFDKFHIHAEYANADGYNGIVQSRNNADGFYTLVSYNITPKLALLGRYDYFTADRALRSSYCQEYTAGFTYNLFKNMKIMLNFVNRNYSDKADSNMILFATRFII